MSGHGEMKSRKADALISALLTERTIEAAAKAVGIGQATARRWMQDPEFAHQ